MSYLAARRPGAAGMHEVVDRASDGSRAACQRLVRAEQETARALDGLGRDWCVLHSVPVGPGSATLAHLVIGPAGLFTVVSVPPRATVVDVVDGQAQLSPHGGDEALAHARQLAQRVRTAVVRRLGAGADVPPVHPVVCMTGGHCAVHPAAGGDEVVGLDRLTAHLLSRPRRLPAADVRRLAGVADEPATWGAPEAEWLPPDLQSQYADATGRCEPGLAGVPPPAADDRVVDGTATETAPPDLPARGAAVRTAGVVMVLLGMASLATGGVLSLPSLAYGALFLRRRGGLAWVDDRDGSLFLVGMVLAGLPLLLWVLLLPLLLGAAA